MIVRLIAIIMILAGLAGLILPVIPGVLLIAAGVLLLFRRSDKPSGRCRDVK